MGPVGAGGAATRSLLFCMSREVSGVAVLAYFVSLGNTESLASLPTVSGSYSKADTIKLGAR